MTTNRRPTLTISALIAVLLLLAHAAAFSALPGVSPEDQKRIMPVSEIKRGMRGYGLTVFQGTKVERFDVEVLGVLKQMNTGKDLIMVRIGGGPITKRSTGIISGMSGSPCYVNGRLIGAISYGSGYAKEPIGMLTPIADMLEAWDESLPARPSGHSSPADLPQPIKVGGKTVRKIVIGGPDDDGPVDGVLHMQPLATPLMVSGVSTRGIGRLAEMLRPYGVQPMAGPGGADKQGISAELKPGAAVGMSLARGDIDITAIGTLTYRRGNKVVAFGHPLLGIGAIDAPLTTAFVDDLISSYRVSTKIASPLKTVGRVFQDRPWSVAGTIGAAPKMIPATITVDDNAFNRRRTFRVSVINHPLLASELLTLVVGEAIYEAHPAPGDATAEVDYEVVADQVGKIKRSNVFFDATSIDTAAVSDVGSLLQLLSSNRFYPLDVKSVNVKVRIIGKRNTATIDRIFVKENEYEPGENVEVGVVLRPYKQERITKTFSVKIPPTTPDGKLTLVVRGGAAAPGAGPITPTDAGQEEGPPISMRPVGGASGLANADNVKQLIDKYLEREKNNELVVQLLTRSAAVNVAGEKLSGLPAAIADVMKSSRNSGLKLEREEVKQTFAQDMIVFGSAQLALNVKRKDLNESKQPTRIVPSAPDGSTDSGPEPSSMSIEFDTVDYSARSSGEVDGTPGAQSEEDTEESEPPKTEEPAKEPEKPADEKSAEKPSAPEPQKTDVKTVVRRASMWTQRTAADFAKGTCSGVAPSSDNKLELTPTLRKLVETPEQFVWCAAPTADGVYVGTGDSGRIYRVTDTGEAKLFYETGELEVHALALDRQGNLYAATSPHGKVFKVTPDGKGEMIFQADEKYVLALAIDQEDNLYAGVGDAGKIYKIPPGGGGSVFADLGDQQILSLCCDARGLAVGAGVDGMVYRVDKFGKAMPVLDAPEDSISSVVTDADGNVYAGTSPKGAVYKISPDGRSKAVYKKAARVLSMACDAAGNVYAVSDNTLVKITPDEKVFQLDPSQDKVQFLCVAYNPATDAIYAGTGSIGSVYAAGCRPTTGRFESAVHDAQAVSKWGTIKWTAEVPDKTTVELQTRTGNAATPDRTWSEWSAPYTNGAGEQIAGGPARYIQYRVTLKTEDPAVVPRVSSVTISYLTPNGKPTVTLNSPVGGEAWAGKKTIRWTGSDPDKDFLTYDVYYSNDGGREWKTLVGGLAGSAGGPNASTNRKTDEEITAKIKSELEKSKDVPEEMKKDLLKELPQPPKPDTSVAPTAPEPASSKTSHTWDTTKTQDGTYLIKVVASDRISNASDALTAEAVSGPFVICNTPPKITLYRKKIVLSAGDVAQIDGEASGKLVEIVGVQYRVDGGNWSAALAGDGIFDSPTEAFSIKIENLASGDHKVEVQSIDAAGNAATESVQVKVRAEKEMAASRRSSGIISL